MLTKTSSWISLSTAAPVSQRVMGFLGTVAATRTRKAAPYAYDSFRGLDDAVLRDIGILRADLYADAPRD